MNTTARLSTVAVSCAALTFSIAPVANAEIVPGESIAGVEIGMTADQAIAAVGREPVKVKEGTNDFGDYVNLKFRHKLRVNVLNGSVVLVTTGSRREWTFDGIHVGSTKRKLRNVYSAVECEKYRKHWTLCHLGDYNPGEQITEFRLKHRKIRSIGVGVVVD